MGDSGKDDRQAERKPRFRQDQYDLLMKCSTSCGRDEMPDWTEWIQYRDSHPGEPIELEGAYLSGTNLRRAPLDGGHPRQPLWGDVCLRGARLVHAHLEDAHLDHADLEGADLSSAHLTKARLYGAVLTSAVLHFAHLRESQFVGADLRCASMSHADLTLAYLDGADLQSAYLPDACLSATQVAAADLRNVCLYEANLSGASLNESALDGAELAYADLRGCTMIGTALRGALFRSAVVDGSTLMTDCWVDRKTNFDAVPLSAARVQPGIKQLLEHNVRRENWREWYNGRREGPLHVLRWLATLPIRGFWGVSNYGMSTMRIIAVFLALALAFGTLYYYHPGFIHDALLEAQEPPPEVHFPLLRACYFSVVTMTTLGFGYIYAELGSRAGHLCLMLQVIMGYVLLGALITRFAVLFQAGGPAGKFEPTWNRQKWQREFEERMRKLKEGEPDSESD